MSLSLASQLYRSNHSSEDADLQSHLTSLVSSFSSCSLLDLRQMASESADVVAFFCFGPWSLVRHPGASCVWFWQDLHRPGFAGDFLWCFQVCYCPGQCCGNGTLSVFLVRRWVFLIWWSLKEATHCSLVCSSQPGSNWLQGFPQSSLHWGRVATARPYPSSF